MSCPVVKQGRSTRCRVRGYSKRYLQDGCNKSLPDPARAGVASELRIAERLQRHCCVIGKRILFPPAPSERGAWFPPGAALPHLVPMDPWKRVCSRTHELQATCRKLCRAASHGPMFARRRGLVIAPGLLHVGGHGQASPLPKQRHCRNPASKSSDASSEHFRSPRAWAGRVSTVGGSPAGRRLIAAFFTRGTIHYSIDSMQTDAPDAVIPSIPDPALCPRLLANNLPFQRTKPYGGSSSKRASKGSRKFSIA
jgi:hypothetical protein